MSLRFTSFALLLCPFTVSLLAESAAPEKKPNVLRIIADDLGLQLSCCQG